MKPRKGLLVHVLRHADGSDCTNRGITSRHTMLILTGPGVPELFEVGPEHPEVVLVRRTIGGKPYLHARSAEIPEGRVAMFGGNFVHTSDGRFPNEYPIAVHDRTEDT